MSEEFDLVSEDFVRRKEEVAGRASSNWQVLGHLVECGWSTVRKNLVCRVMVSFQLDRKCTVYQ